MPNAKPRTVPVFRQVVLASYWYGIYFLWGSFIAIVLPFLLVPEHPDASNPALVPIDHKNTALAVLETIGLIFPIVVQPLAGAWSDRLRTRWGRRRPLIAVGAAGGVIALGMVVESRHFIVLLGAYCLLQIFMNVSQGGYQGLLPDVVPGGERGEASGFLGVGSLLGQVSGFVAAGLFSAHVDVVITAGVIAATAAATCYFVKEQPLAAVVPAPRPAGGAVTRWASQGRGYLAEFARYPDFCWVVGSRFLSYTGLAAIQRFAANYLRDRYTSFTLGSVHLPSAQTATSATFAIVVTFGLLATYPAVKLSERIGRRRVLVLASAFGALGSMLFFFASSFTQVLICAAPIGVSFGMLVSVDWAYMADLAPRSRSGKFLGFSNVATAGSQAFAPTLLGPVIDGVNHRGGGHSTAGYNVVFLTSAVFFILGAVSLSRVRLQRIPEADEDVVPVSAAPLA